TPIQDDLPRFLNASRKTLSSLAFALIPISFLAIAVAKPGFVFFLTDTWVSSIILFQILCFASIFTSLTDLNANFLNIKGRAKFLLCMENIKVCLAIQAQFLPDKHGLVMYALGLVAVRIIGYIIAASMSGRVYGYHLFMQDKVLLPTPLIATIAAGLA